jgi:hypothetical protein
MTDNKKLRISRLRSASDVRHELGRLYRAGRRDELPPVSAYRLALILKILLQSIETTDLELRIEKLEVEHGK